MVRQLTILTPFTTESDRCGFITSVLEWLISADLSQEKGVALA